MNPYLTPFIAIAGIIVGWSLNFFTNWFERRSLENRKRKAVIFTLLEVIHILGTLNIKLVKKVFEEFLPFLSPEFKSTNNQNIENKAVEFWQPLIKQIVSQR